MTVEVIAWAAWGAAVGVVVGHDVSPCVPWIQSRYMSGLHVAHGQEP